jgi:glycosyltransferase involved in cell wall biosynthesis
MSDFTFSKVSIVIPALNEEGVVGKTVRSIDAESLKKLNLDVEIIVVDNNSTDNTAKEAREAGAKVVTEKRRGYGSAYLRGLREAKGDIIVMGDADGTYPLDNTAEFIEPLLNGQADFVIGSRLKGNIHDGAMPWLHRYIGNPVLTFTGNFLFKTRVSDFHCGMRAFTRDALNKMSLHTTGMEFATEMIVEAGRKNLRIAEIPIEYRKRGGKAKLNSFSDGWRHLRFMLMYSPDYLFILPGALISFLGVILMLMLVRGPVNIGGISLQIHPMILGSMLTLLGFQVLIIGAITKNFVVAEGFANKDRYITFLNRYFTLERAILLGAVVFLAGFLINANILYTWYSTGFGPLPTLRIAVFAATLIILGIQIIFSAWFMSIMGIERHER